MPEWSQSPVDPSDPILQTRRHKPTATATCARLGSHDPCSRANVVYKATCKICQEFYLGGSARPIHFRAEEHEASVRYKNNTSALGQHRQTHAPRTEADENRRPYERVGKRDYKTFLELYDFELVDFGKDPLDTFIREGLLIKELRPKLNNCLNNGFVR